MAIGDDYLLSPLIRRAVELQADADTPLRDPP